MSKYLITILLLMYSYQHTIAQSVIWNENFSGYNNATVGRNKNTANPAPDWEITYNGNGDVFASGNRFLVRNSETEAIWTSEVIDISNYNYVEVNAQLSWFWSTFRNRDYVQFYYKLDGGPETSFFERESEFIDADETSEQLEQVFSGTSLQIIVKIQVDYFRIIFFTLEEYVEIENISVNEVVSLYSRKNGRWNDGTTWSANDFSEAQPPCNCTPTASEAAVIGNNNTVSITSNAEAGIVDVYNTGNLTWGNDNNLSIARGILKVRDGGEIYSSGNTSQLWFTNPNVLYALSNDGSIRLTNMVLREGVSVVDAGTGEFIIDNLMTLYEGDAQYTHNATGVFNTDYLYLNDANNLFINNAEITATNSLLVNGNDSQLDNNGILTFNALDLNNRRFNLNNNGVLNQTGDFLNIPNSGALNNNDQAVWNWSFASTNIDADVRRILTTNEGDNLFEYSSNGNQNIIPVTYSNIRLSGNGIKYTTNDLNVERDLMIAASAILDVNRNRDDINLGGDWKNTSDEADAFVEGNRTVIINGNQTQYIEGDKAQTFYNLRLDKDNANLILGQDVRVTNQFRLDQGLLEVIDNNVTIAESGNIIGGDNNSYVKVSYEGALEQEGLGSGGRTGNVKFPVGLSDYAPLSINNSTGVKDVFSVRMCNGISLLGACIGENIFEKVVDLTWYIDEGTKGGSNANLNFQWNKNRELQGFERSAINVMHYNGKLWEAIAKTSAAGNGPYNAGAMGVQDFSPFGIQYDDGPLPVELRSFEAKITEQDAVQLKWITDSELNNDFFTVERSGADLKAFEALKTIQGKGTTTEVNNYVWEDQNPLAGVSYYRLKQTDYDGTFTYSQVQRVNYIPSAEDVTIFPVPSNGENIRVQFTLPGISSGEVTLKVIDVYGRQLLLQHHEVQAGKNELELNFNQKLGAGNYILSITGGVTSHYNFIVSN